MDPTLDLEKIFKAITRADRRIVGQKGRADRISGYMQSRTRFRSAESRFEELFAAPTNRRRQRRECVRVGFETNRIDCKGKGRKGRVHTATRTHIPEAEPALSECGGDFRTGEEIEFHD